VVRGSEGWASQVLLEWRNTASGWQGRGHAAVRKSAHADDHMVNAPPDMIPGMQADDALTILSALDERGVHCWLDGGWGVDCLLGSRPERTTTSTSWSTDTTSMT
jgi:hypothetical protein